MNISSKELVRMIGADLAAMINPGTLIGCLRDTMNSDPVTAKELAIARALLYRVAGSALLNGEAYALKDAALLYRMLIAANTLLSGSTREHFVRIGGGGNV